MRLTIRVLGLTALDIDLTDQDDEAPGGVDSAVTTQAEPRFGFIPGALEYDKPQP